MSAKAPDPDLSSLDFTPPLPPIDPEGIAHALTRLANYGYLTETDDDPERADTMLEGAGIDDEARQSLWIGLQEEGISANALLVLWPGVLFGVLVARMATEHAVLEAAR